MTTVDCCASCKKIDEAKAPAYTCKETGEPICVAGICDRFDRNEEQNGGKEP